MPPGYEIFMAVAGRPLEPQDTRIWAEQTAHLAIVDPSTFARAQELLAARGPATQGRAAVRNRRPTRVLETVSLGDPAGAGPPDSKLACRFWVNVR